MRSARKLGESGFYHVVSKGEADQLLFFNNGDRQHYVDLLASARDEFSLHLHSYCIMSNHVHLLVEEGESDVPEGSVPGVGTQSMRHLSLAMKQLNERYAEHFKRSTGRTGHVFKNRFWSEPIEDEAYLLCCMRYIHANPAAAKICKASAYSWSSVRDYLGRDGITDTDLLLDMCDGRKGFINFSRDEPPTARPFPGSRLAGHLTPEEQRWVAEQVVGESFENLSKQDPATRDEVLEKLLECGLSNTEVASLTGLSLSTVYRFAHNRDKKGTVPFVS